MSGTDDTAPRTFPVDTAGHVLRGDVAAAYLRAVGAGLPTGGVDVFQRTWDEQAALYDAYLHHHGVVAAAPSWHAPHIDARAFDTHTTGAAGGYEPSPAHSWLSEGGDGSHKPAAGERLRAHEFGFRRSVPSERWHFEYNPGLDQHRAADLAARLATLGFATVRAFQVSAGLDDDGEAGQVTWTALLGADYPAPGAPARTMVPDPPRDPAGPVDFRAATYNAELRHFGGGAPGPNALFVDESLRCSVLAGQEVDEAARNSICEANGFKVWAYKTLGIFWNPDKYDHGERIEVDLGTAYHGMIATELTSRKNGTSFVAAAVHIRPRAAFASKAAADAGKRADIKKVLEKLSGHRRVMVGGDWSSNARAQVTAAGYDVATPNVDTYDKDGEQHLDAIFVRGIDVRGNGREHETGASDHDGLVATLTLPLA
ncbi:hypothetical protein [Propionicimonas sp.]|uniref:hypothetical protein n=1 Tax=Propionicimonas sp. TaxID=1955623 RepID=UPI0039E562D7